MSLCPAARVLIALDIFSSFWREAAAAPLLFASGWGSLGWRERRARLPVPPIPLVTLAKSLFSVVK